jgi:ribonucleoside-diphosphate reductase alpha chain
MRVVPRRREGEVTMAIEQSLEAAGRVARTGEARRGLTIPRRFVPAGVNPYDTVEWEIRSAVISSEGGETVFEQRDVEMPRSWSQLATNVVVSKYFRGPLGPPQRERRVRQLIGRVVDTISQWGEEQGYFASPEDRQNFGDELSHILLHQKASFNSPVWFNMGVEAKPQCSACFILSVDDSMDSILDWYRKEGVIFKGGSGSGVNLSRLRSSRERLAGGGTASGPVSFMRAADASAGVIKSGGKTRRAAKMVVLDVDHPDVVEFIRCKAEEEKKAWALIAAGYDASLDGPAYASIFFQNANNSVRVTDEFMHAALDGRPWSLRAVTSKEVLETRPARDVLRMIAEATHQCGDPGMQFDTTINDWHTCPNTGRINASNPCSEYMHLDDSACNLASLNLMQFAEPNGGFDVAAFRHAVNIMIAAQDILVDRSSYPTAEITRNAQAYRELGLGYANLGALLMSLGLPYDSDAGREYAAAVTALMCGQAYLQSAAVAAVRGPYEGFARNRDPQLRVIEKHRTHAHKLNSALVPLDLLAAAREAWDEALEAGRRHGVRNSQVTVLAPTGTIAFMMDCDTTGVEPDIALIKYKKLVGGGFLKIVNNTVPRALRRLGYDSREVQDVVEYLDEQETIEGAPKLRSEHLPVFDCAFKPARGTRSIHHLGHLRMMGAVQPFVSGAISKTINLPETATLEDIEGAYIEAWRLGLKAVAIYRDGCKKTQPLNTAKSVKAETAPAAITAIPQPVRRRLPPERQAMCHKFDIAGHEGYLHVGFHEDGTPGEIFIKMAKEGSDLRPHGRARRADLDGAAVRRPARGAGVEVQPRALRAVGLHQELRDSDGEVGDRLHLPFPRLALPLERASGGGRAGGARGAGAVGGAGPGGGGSPERVGARHRLQPPGGRAELSGVRLDHGPQRQLLQVPQLRRYQWLLLTRGMPGSGGGDGVAGWVASPRGGGGPLPRWRSATTPSLLTGESRPL